MGRLYGTRGRQQKPHILMDSVRSIAQAKILHNWAKAGFDCGWRRQPFSLPPGPLLAVGSLNFPRVAWGQSGLRWTEDTLLIICRSEQTGGLAMKELECAPGSARLNNTQSRPGAPAACLAGCNVFSGKQ